MSNTAIKQPTKSILKQNHTINSNTTSWFSKFNNTATTIENTATTTATAATVATSPLPRINSLFGSFRKQQHQPLVDLSQHSITSQEDIAVIAELVPKEIRRVRFPVTDMTTEFLFKKEDLITDRKKQSVMEPISIQTSAQFLSLYESVCQKKQEPTIDLFISVLISQPQATFLTKLDLTNQPIDRQNIAPLADIMCVEFGIRELVLNHCGLENGAIKILMQSLLENDKIKQLSLADNPKLSTVGFKYIGIYIKGSSQLTSLDLSYTQPDKKSIQYITAAALKEDASSPSPSLYNLVLNGCNLRAPLLETLAAGIRKPFSSVRQISIRSNRIANTGSALAIGVMLRDYDDNQQGLERLYLDNNDFSQNGGIQYIAQALRRNQSLRYLSMCECRIDSKGCVLLGEALKYNQYLERFDIGYNPLCTPNMDGITSIRQALNVNRSLKDLCLAETGLGTEAAIALAESLPENNSLVRLDLSRNPLIQIAGLMAISVSIRMNSNITFIDINIPNDDKDMVEIHNGILAACTKNAQLKKQVAQDTTQTNINHPLVTTAQATARLTLQERLAAVTKGKQNPSASSSEVTSIAIPPPLPQRKPKYDNDNDALLIQQAFDQVGSLEDIISGRIPEEEQKEEETEAVFNCCKGIQSNISLKIPQVADASHLELLLAINDRLIMAIQSFDENHTSKAVQAIDIAVVQQQKEDTILSSSFEIGDDDDDDDDEVLEDDLYEGELERDNHLKELRSEIEAEESAAFLNAKKEEVENEAKLEEKEASSIESNSTDEQ